VLEMKKSAHFSAGFTLIELMVTIAIVAIAASIGIPSLTTFQRNAELTTTANNFVALLSNARAEAMTKGIGTMIVPADGISWASGATSFVDVARDGNPASASNIKLGIQSALPSYLVTTGPANFRFDPSGFAVSNNGTISLSRDDVSGNEALRQTRRIKVANTGRVRACTPVSASDSNCSAVTTSY
jgi:type IV fimbrial biogenesis protein FimT